MDRHDFLDLLKQLIRQPAVVGAEHSFYQVIKRELDELGVRVSMFEGLLVAEGNDPASLRVSAHVDRHGLVCTGPNEFQYAAYVARNRGDLTGSSISEQTYQTMAGRFGGDPLHAYEPWSGVYLGTGTIRTSYLCERRGNIIFETEGLGHLLPGTPVAYLDRMLHSGDRISAQLDNVLSVAVLIHLFRQGFQGTAFFTSQEEAGRSWRFLLEWFQRYDLSTDRLLVLDTSPFPDRVQADAQDLVLRRRDAHALFAPDLVSELEAICGRLKFSYLFKDEWMERNNREREAQGLGPRSIGSTELGRLSVASGGKIQGATLQIPTTGYHTPRESARLTSVFGCIEVIWSLAGLKPPSRRQRRAARVEL
ncbi:MAG: peptidase M42 [Verrucomicrobia bacterium]|nr:peptidase M42 [Verrucomicrobiota bacterium]